MTYTAKIAQLKNKDAMISIGNFVTAVLNENFEEVRNKTKHNLHLHTLAASNPSTLKAWHEPLPTLKLTYPQLKANADGDYQKVYTFVESTDPFELFLIGKCDTTCQSINGAPHQTYGLLSTLLDGKIRGLLIKNEKNRTVARMLIKLLWDGEKAVVFQECIYVDCKQPEVESTLQEIVKLKAKMLKAPLTRTEKIQKSNTLIEEPLFALGSSIPFEYYDTFGNVKK